MFTDTLFEILIRALCDTFPTEQADGAYLFCQTADNQQSVFQTAQHLFSQSHIATILILQTKAKNGYPGFDEWHKLLCNQGVQPEVIKGIGIDETTPLNTLTESEALVRWAKTNNCKSLFVVASPFQQLRAFMTAVTVATRVYPELTIYSAPGGAMSWIEEVTHSQGSLRAQRHKLIQTELDRIQIYQRKGDLTSFEHVLEYLNTRHLSDSSAC